MFKKKKIDELSIMEQVKKDYEIKSKRMDPRLKKHIKYTILGFVFFLFVLTIIIIIPRNTFDEKDHTNLKILTYKEIISRMSKNGFKFDAKNNPEGYLLEENGTTYLIKKFYKENYLDSDLKIYAYTNYNNQKGVVVNKIDDKYKIFSYDTKITIYCDNQGNILEESNNNINFYNNNKEIINRIIIKIEELNKNIFEVSSNEKKEE